VDAPDGVPRLAPALIGSESGYDPAYFQAFAAIEQTNFWFVNRAILLTRLCARFFPRAQRMLEIGCGTGSAILAFRRALPGLSIIGSGLHPEGLVHARRRLDDAVRLLQMDARAIPSVAHFDVVGAFDVIEHIDDDERVLRAMHGALRPGGGIIIAVPQHSWLWSPFDDASRHERRYERGELERKLEAAGFEVVYSTSYNMALLPLMLASRIFMQRRAARGEAFDELRELKIGRAANAVLRTILRGEVALSSRGVRWPFGGSRIVVARMHVASNVAS
jgi:SAM-dependent methyltransferase